MIEQKLSELRISLPTLSENKNPFDLGVMSGNNVYLSGQVPMIDGKIEHKGTVGSTVTVEEAQEAAVMCTLNLLSALKTLIGDLNKVKKIVKINGYIASEKDFHQQPQVMNAASSLLNDIFGRDNSHARSAIGVAALPLGVSVEVEMIVEIH